MTAAVFEAVFVHRGWNEISKTKLHFNLSPAVGINTVLAPVRVHRWFVLDSDKSPPIIYSGRVWLQIDWNVVGLACLYSKNCLKKILSRFFRISFPKPKKISRSARFSCLRWGADFERVRAERVCIFKVLVPGIVSPKLSRVSAYTEPIKSHSQTSKLLSAWKSLKMLACRCLRTCLYFLSAYWR